MNYEKYLTQDEMKEIAKDTFRQMLMESPSMNMQTLVANAAYEVVFKIVDEQYNEKLNYVIAEKVQDIIKKLTYGNVFRSRGVPNAVLDIAVTSNKKLIANRVALLAGEINKDDVVAALMKFKRPEIKVTF